MVRHSFEKSNWDVALEKLLSSSTIYAVMENESGLDYEILVPDQIPFISYNKPKPVTPLKTFFLPVRENVTVESSQNNQVIILGVPNCDVIGLKILDEIYLDPDFPDLYYKQRRDNTLIISSDCLSIQDHCHCTSYGIDPFANNFADISLIVLDETVTLTIISKKGEAFVQQLSALQEIELKDESLHEQIELKHREVLNLLEQRNSKLPDYKKTGELVADSKDEIWQKYASDCVSCGACAAICPTCSCFLLNDKPGFEKVRQLDACQYPGFERVAGDEDALHQLYMRFRNRYMCKYVWKPEKFQSIACTGCGRCIETCIGGINKNELFMELSN